MLRVEQLEDIHAKKHIETHPRKSKRWRIFIGEGKFLLAGWLARWLYMYGGNTQLQLDTDVLENS